jgi:branched-chain amino acid aminotransferase
MAIAWFRDGVWESFSIQELQSLPLHPAAHALQFGSSIFEGFKAFRHDDDSIRIFRLDRHVERFRNSAKALYLPPPDEAYLREMVFALINANRDAVPPAPEALYLRSVMIGTSPIIAGSAFPSAEACLYILGSPVGDLFAGGARPLRLVVDEVHARATPQLGSAKAGANYAAGLGPVMSGKHEYQADQVLFAPGGEVREAGGAGFILLNDETIMGHELDGSFLPSVTRDAILTLAPDLGYRPVERSFTVDEMLSFIRDGEAALCGTAAVLSGVGELVARGVTHTVGTGAIGKNTLRVRKALTDVQTGQASDPYGWLTIVDAD